MAAHRPIWKSCLSALRGLGCVPVAVIVALAPGFRAVRGSAPIPRPVGHLLQAGRNEALERRLRWSRIRLGAVLEARAQPRTGATIAKISPWGSRPWAIQLPPGTSIGPMMTLPPASVTRSIAASMASTLK